MTFLKTAILSEILQNLMAPQRLISDNMDGLVLQDRSISIVYALEILQSCSNPYGSGHEGAAVLLPGFAIIW